MSFDRIVRAGAVVLGAGVAGLAAALDLGDDVVIVTKTAFGQGGSTGLAQGGIAAAVAREDSPELHASDTIGVGAGLNDPETVRILTQEGPGRVRRLLGLGAEMDRKPNGELSLGLEAGHSRHRILHADGDRTGAELLATLSRAVTSAGIAVEEHAFAADLVVDDDRVAGVTAIGRDGERILFLTSAVVVATGGAGRLYAHTTNPIEVTGDGLAMAARAGVRLTDLEFVQFHPTALAAGADPMPLLTEALRGEGAVLVDGNGRRFMPDIHPDAELAPRDVVARAIWSMREAGSAVYLDARAAVGEAFPTRFPTVFGICREAGIDPRRQRIPAAPAAHYLMGGIETDGWGRSSLTGLWAAGEAAATGVHGANRLASNSLLEGLVFGARVAESIRASESAPPVVSRTTSLRDRYEDPSVVAALRRVMWSRVGLVRHRDGLQEAVGELEGLAAQLPPGAGETANMLVVARLVALAARARRESRGAHFRSDHPESGIARRIVFEGEAMLPAVAA